MATFNENEQDENSQESSVDEDQQESVLGKRPASPTAGHLHNKSNSRDRT
jgi:hypothetical protein